jgi:hypothetical protein
MTKITKIKSQAAPINAPSRRFSHFRLQLIAAKIGIRRHKMYAKKGALNDAK